MRTDRTQRALASRGSRGCDLTPWVAHARAARREVPVVDSSARGPRSDGAPDGSAAWPATPATPATAGASPVEASTSAALRCWLQAQRRAHAPDGEIDPAEVRRTMRRLAEAGRARGAPVERLIVLLKELWASLPADGDGHRAAHGVGSRTVLDGIIRVCIEEFYAAPGAEGAETGWLAPERRRGGGASAESTTGA